MEEMWFSEDVKNRLMFAGMKELEEHGVNDFSLRRVASRAQVSCAAPYRHFKSREDLISAVLGFIRERFFLFCKAVRDAYREQPHALCIELAISQIRFLIASPQLISILLLSSSEHAYREQIAALDAPLCEAVQQLYPIEWERILSKMLSHILGYSVLIVRGSMENDEKSFAQIRGDLEKCIEM